MMRKLCPCCDVIMKCGSLYTSWDKPYLPRVWVCWLRSFLHHPDLSQGAKHQYPADRTSPCLIPPNGYWLAIMNPLVMMATITAWSLRKAEVIRQYWFYLSYIQALPKLWQQLVHSTGCPTKSCWPLQHSLFNACNVIYVTSNMVQLS